MTSARDARFPFVPSLPGPPLSVASAEGVWLTLADGTRILDAAGGAIAVNVGHGRREVADAMAASVLRNSYAVPVFATEERLTLMEMLAERWLPEGLTRTCLTSGGSEAVDAALRLARQHHVAAGRDSRWKVLGREMSYHGATVATLSVGGHEKRRAALEPMLIPFPKAPTCYCLRCPLGRSYPECDVACADAVEEAILREGPDTVAAFIAEPVIGSAGGAVDPPAEYWPRVAEICRRHGVLLIADEVMTGFGRTGRRFGVDHWGVVPDILVGGKGLAGTYAPLGAVFAREAVVEPMATVRDELMFYTYGGHPAACAAACAVLDILEREDLVTRAAEMGCRLRKALEERLADHPHVAQVRGLGLMQAVELVRDRETLEPFPAKAGMAGRVVVEGLLRGVFFYPAGSGAAQDAVALGPPFVIEEPEIDLLADTLGAAIDGAAAAVAGR